ncbi:hypothetical protein [Embleya sp. NPDC059237]|uniref:hypothetical protein n=1 Tax=Embleya sp. NPDC059237 TaxID=3346784 RepID=UPI003687CF5B
MTTPVSLRLLVAGVVVTLVAYLGVLLAAISAADDGLRTVGAGAGPRVVSANALHGALSGMDAELANTVLVGDERGLGFAREQAAANYAAERKALGDAIEETGAGIEGDEARRTLADLVDKVGLYDNLAGQATLLDRQSDARALTDASPALPLLRQAADLMRDTLLPEADRLSAANAGAVEATYRDTYGRARDLGGWLLALGPGAIGVLLCGQAFVAVRTRRVVNPGMLIATVLAVALVWTGTGATLAAAEHLRTAKKDAFDSVLELTRARAVATDANRDESRFLLDRARATDAERAFEAKSRELAGFDGVRLDGYAEALRSAITGLPGLAKGATPPFDGRFGREFRNITFAGERAAAEDALRWYTRYQDYDRQLRTMVTRGDLRGAIDFATSHRENNSNWAFDHLIESLEAVTAINRTHMDAEANAGRDALADLGLIATLLVLAAAGATWAGVRTRLVEYRAGEAAPARIRPRRPTHPGPPPGRPPGPATLDRPRPAPEPVPAAAVPARR